MMFTVDFFCFDKNHGFSPFAHCAGADYKALLTVETLARLLLAFDADPDSQDAQRRTPLHAAALAGHVALVNALLQNSADPASEDEDGSRPLHLAARSRQAVALTTSLLSARADLNAPNAHGEIPLHVAATGGNVKLLKLLVASRANLHAPSRSPLVGAAERGHSAAAAVLLDLGAKPPLQPALRAAARVGHASVVEVLLSHGADATVPDAEGFSPVDWAHAAGHASVLSLLGSRILELPADGPGRPPRPSRTLSEKLASSMECRGKRQVESFRRLSLVFSTAGPFFLKNLKSVLKWWALLFHAHPLAFARANVSTVLHTSVEVLRTLTGLQVSTELRPWLEGLLRSSLLMLAHGFNTVSIRQGPQPKQQGVAQEAAAACHSQFGDFVRGHGVGDLCELACRAALRLTEEEVQAWLEEPEDQLLGPQCQTELHQAGESCIRALGQPPLHQPLVEHIAKRMQEEIAQPPSLNDAFELVARKDMFLSLLALCQSQLKPHLQFPVMLGFFSPIASLVPHLGPQAAGILLPVRLCVVIRAWAAEIPENALVSVVQLLQGFLRSESPKAVRLAALSPLRAMLDRFSDSEAWTEVQGGLIDSCLALLSIVKAPEVQWRCLNLIHLFLVEEAESGRYQATEKTLEQLVTLWRRPEEGELLIRHALLDVLRALVLMSDRTRSPRLALSPPLLSCCLTVISDCYAVHRGPSSPQRGGYEATAALQADAESAAGALGDAGSATATLFDSGSVLFLGVLRTVDVEQAAPLMPFFPKLLAQQTAMGGPPPEWTMDILLEYCALHCSGGAAAHLAQFYPALLQICWVPQLWLLHGVAVG
ncbi:ANK1 [Symbiodinium natans]|uniref:ANK1 protein n=1 Tax=Symbiodinium natans TaxID=878477 RepID=A0A812J5D5_9DINO|nr:ANK1 [Symbiodinium natans]